MDTFSQRFKDLKTAKNVTYQQIAVQLDLNLRMVQYYASGKSKPDYYGLIKLADYFEVSVDYLLGRTDNPNSHKI